MAIVLGAYYNVNVKAENAYYFIIEKKEIEKKENPAGGAIDYAYHWMWYEKDREPSTNALGYRYSLKR